jgi:hypothetical protein
LTTRKVASDLSSKSKKPEPVRSVRTTEIYAWASQLASETRKSDWVLDWYVWPNAIREIIHKLETISGGIVGLVGFQGVGKSSALQAIFRSPMEQADRGRGKDGEMGPGSRQKYRIVLFKWRRESELFRSLMNRSHEASESFLSVYLPELLKQSSISIPSAASRGNLLHRLSVLEHEAKSLTSCLAAQRDPEFYASGAAYEETNRLERKFDKSTLKKLRETAWLRMLRQNEVILIDTPDYSKTDRRLMAKDLEGVYWLWNTLALSTTSAIQPNIVLAIQKEMFRDHFFFDKMEKVELEPLRPAQMVEAYRKRFNSVNPFTEDALLSLARMSRGIFRRFLRYITLTLRDWDRTGREAPIDIVFVKQAVPTARLAEDMELELAELFPKHSDLRLLAVRLLMLLAESGERRQSELAELLEVEPYMLSRLLTKLETARYVIRRREGNDKIVSVYSQKTTRDAATNQVVLA